MNKKTKAFIITIAALISFIVICNFFINIFPLMGTEVSVSNYILKTIPLGTSYDDAVEIVNNHKKWEKRAENLNGGLSIYPSGQIGFEFSNDKDDPDIKIIGEKALDVFVGEYYAPFCVSVCAYLVFDENDKLIGIRIRNDVDAL